MRVSQSLIVGITSRDLDLKSRRLVELQKQASSGKRVAKPSDDPLSAYKIMDLKGSIRRVEGALRSADALDTWYSMTESAVQEMEQSLVRAKEIALAGSSSTATTSSRQMAAKEVRLIFDQIVQLANTRLGDRYLFGGSDTQSPPVDRGEDYTPLFQGNDQHMEIRVGGDRTLIMNITAVETLKESGVLDTLQGLIQALEGDDQSAVAAAIDGLDKGISTMNTTLAEVGSRASALGKLRDMMLDSRLELQSTLSQYEDADIAQVFTELAAQRMVYEAALKTTASILNRPSLMSYL